MLWRSSGERMHGSGSAVARLPVRSNATAGHPASFPSQLGGHPSCAAAAACLCPGARCQPRFGPSRRIQLPRGVSSPPDIWITPRLLRAGRLGVAEGGGMLGNRGERGGRALCSLSHLLHLIATVI